MYTRKLSNSSSAILALALSTAAAMPAAADTAELDAKVMETMERCVAVSESCAERSVDAQGVLVFPRVVTVELGIGGAGGHGALVENGTITGYYKLGEADVGYEAGIDVASYVFVIDSEEALSKVQNGKWSVGVDAGITVVKGMNAEAESSADIYSYVFGAKGLDTDVSVDLLRIWPEDED